jgi:hypothetical protein
MCGGVMYIRNNKIEKVYFPNPKAELPVLCRDNSIEYVKWGRRSSQNGDLPIGGWARLESLKKGYWDQYFPKHVKIMIDEFMERDKSAGQTHWFSVTKGAYVHGIVARMNNEVRLYVVTVATPENDIHDRWPRIIANTR